LLFISIYSPFVTSLKPLSKSPPTSARKMKTIYSFHRRHNRVNFIITTITIMLALRPKLTARHIASGFSHCAARITSHRSFRSQFLSTMASANNTSSASYEIDAFLVPGFIKWIERCNNGEAALASGEFLPFQIDNQTVGYIGQNFIQHLKSFPDVFQLTPTSILLHPNLQTADIITRSTAVGVAMSSLKDSGIITGWRNELYPVLKSFYDDPVLLLERAAAPFFGIKAYGVHMNGYVKRKSDGEILLWVARRSATKLWPLKLDHIVAGGQPHGLSLAENVVKECQEEAGITSEIARKAVPVGAVSYISIKGSGLGRDVLFCYDLELPEDFQPVPVDGEVHEFFLSPLSDVAKFISDGTFETDDHQAYKDNCNLVVLDFLIRHGVLTPDTPGYLDVIKGLRSGDCS
jgi:hypothetical protein